MSRDSRLPDVFYVYCVLMYRVSHVCMPLCSSFPIEVIQHTDCCAFTTNLRSVTFFDEDKFTVGARIYKTDIS